MLRLGKLAALMAGTVVVAAWLTGCHPYPRRRYVAYEPPVPEVQPVYPGTPANEPDDQRMDSVQRRATNAFSELDGVTGGAAEAPAQTRGDANATTTPAPAELPALPALSKQDVIDLVTAKVETNSILAVIARSRPDFMLNAQAVIELHEAGVPTAIIDALFARQDAVGPPEKTSDSGASSADPNNAPADGSTTPASPVPGATKPASAPDRWAMAQPAPLPYWGWAPGSAAPGGRYR